MDHTADACNPPNLKASGGSSESNGEPETGAMTTNEPSEIKKPNYLSGKSRIRIDDLKEAKLRKEKWAMLTSYDFVSARIFDRAKIPCLLVGDSAAQMVFGYSSTIPITMDEMIPIARAVSSACRRALVIADMPFGSYQESPKVALKNAVRFMKESLVHGVKLEGGKEYAEHVNLLTRSGIPVMAHIGFTPQSEHALSGFKVQGRNEDASVRICEDALALEEAGAFACVLELMPAKVGRAVTECLKIPTVGIGAGPHCDAQILVWHDMAGFSAPRDQATSGGNYLGGAGAQTSSTVSTSVQGLDKQMAALELNRVPKFVKRYTNLSEMLFKAAISYADEVSSGEYPAEEHCYS